MTFAPRRPQICSSQAHLQGSSLMTSKAFAVQPNVHAPVSLHVHRNRLLPKIELHACAKEVSESQCLPVFAEATVADLPDQLNLRVNGNGTPQSLPNEADTSSITNFLRGRTAFVTGATGFLAKVLVEKMLREQPEINHVYLLIRGGTTNAHTRLVEQVIKSPVFDRLRLIHGAGYEAFMLSKLTAVQGNMSEPQLGIEAALYTELQRSVDVVVNSAATTTFDEPYDVALRINTLGAAETAKFAAGCSDLKVLVHVSTAFVNGYREGQTPEQAFSMNHTIASELAHTGYPSPDLDVEYEIQSGLQLRQQVTEQVTAEMRSASQDDIAAAVEQRLKQYGIQRAQRYGWQDTYVFTKAMGEMLLGRESERLGLPIAVVRPSIVESALREPLQGWMEGIRMCDPIILAYGKGNMAGFAGNRWGVIDIVPVDHVINATLAVMPRHCQRPGVTVYQVATSTANPLAIPMFVEMVSKHFQESPMLDRDGKPVAIKDMKIYNSPRTFVFSAWCRYQLPLELMEWSARLMPWMNGNGKEMRKNRVLAKKTMEQLTYLADIYCPYTFYRCRFGTANTEKLFESLSAEEQKRFNFNLKEIDWQEYLKDIHIPGLRKFVLKGRA